MTSFYILLAAFLCVASGVRSTTSTEVDNDISFSAGTNMFRKLLETTDELATAVIDANVTNSGECTILQRLEVGFKREGNAFRTTAAFPNAGYCAFSCAIVVQGCVAMNYDETNKMCYFLDNPGAIYAATGYTTALLNPPKDTICNSNNMLLAYSRPGNDMIEKPFILPTATDCCRLCAATKDCVAYDFVYAPNHCWLKNATSELINRYDVVTSLLCTEPSVQTVIT